ncbi:DUF3883 domain-containing protein [Chryseobacterium sp. GMJ5]|uniref:DUF3883 domain-containing protein n=1 Tax=Chryseobacterium gilvum TaxID=2976534 RepID=A0ABT2VXV2_9FLAO|nr:DUF3883 domain-containing protein [Chryseobacterium gilvum]MCU7614833.1 DUF3883 domain-containing protein [Chryseobacterium gilvum]
MNTLNKQGIEEEIKTRTETYRNDPPILLSGYNQEKQTVQDYEGRQLLELMQNADDAKSDILRIELDTANCVLSIKNNGDAFSLEGVKSLMFTGNSTKNKEEYIGNKGLGFRSILSWVNTVSIHTQTVSFRFSESYSQTYFKQHIADSEKVILTINAEVKAKKLRPDEIPIAALAFPEMIDNDSNQDVVTNIVLNVKKEEIGAIEKQIAEITEEILLFLPNIKQLIVLIDGVVQIDLQKRKDEENQIIINNSHWNIYRSGSRTFDDNAKTSKFKYAIAWKDDMSVEGKFYNYFPTDIYTQLPCIIHATFDLNSSRKEINETNANKYILHEIVTSLGDIADKRLKKKTADWQAYQFLTAANNTKRKVLELFYAELIKNRETISVYPTVNQEYLKKEEVIYHGEQFSQWVIDNGYGDAFRKLGLPIEEKKIHLNKRFTPHAFYHAVSEIKEILTLNQRVALIGILAIREQYHFKELHDSNMLLPLLTNKEELVVSEKIKVFTKNTEGTEFIFPDYINDVEFISVELFDSIRKEFKDEITQEQRENESGDARAIKRLLDPVVNIGLDDITGVIQHIISETKKIIAVDEDSEIVRLMVMSLFSIYKTNEDRKGNLSTIEKIPLLARDGSIVHSEDLYFGKEFPCGTDTEFIFESVFGNNQYLASAEAYGLDNNGETISNFFTWLNVNRMTKYQTISKSLGRWEADDYSNFILSLQKGQRDDVYKTYQVTDITKLFDILQNNYFSIEKLIVWIAKDDFFLEQLRWINKDEISFEFGRDKKYIEQKPSYILHTILKSGITKNIFGSNSIDGISSFKSINVDDDFFKLLTIPDYKVREILDLLYIKSSFNNLKPNQVYSILKNQQNDISQNSQSFYKLLHEYFKENEETQLKDYEINFDGINYISRKGGLGKDYETRPVEEVYYSDNKMLPQQLLNQYWFINLPKRTGENRVAKFFGVKLIKDIVNNIQFDIEQEHPFNKELSSYLTKLKPYLLCYRLDMLTKDSDKKDAAKNLKKLQIHLVKKANYSVNDEIFPFKDFDFIPKDNEVILRYSTDVQLENLQRDPLFCDVIAEIICVTFKIADQNKTFRRIFKDGIQETLHILKSDEKDDLIISAQQLLGISQQETDFWKKVFPNEFFDYDTDSEMQIAIEQLAKNTLPEGYHKLDFENWSHSIAIDFLKWVQDYCNVNINELIHPKAIESWHLNNIDNLIKDHLSHIEQLLWKQANDSSGDELKKTFYEKARQFEDSKHEIYSSLQLHEQVCLNSNYLAAIKQLSLEKFIVNLDDVMTNKMHISAKYDSLISKYSFGDSLEDMIKLIKNQDRYLFSLMHFEGFEEQVESVCDTFQEENSESLSNELEDDEEDILAIFEGTTGASGITFSATNSGSSGGGSHTSKVNRQNASSGKKQENRVKKSLEKNGYVVNHVSKKTDGKHYDFEYKKDDDVQWRLLEVKKDSGGYFFLSKDEKNTALCTENADKYDVAIVNENGIYIIKSLFNLGDERFESNDKFTVETTEYKIHYKLNDNENKD